MRVIKAKTRWAGHVAPMGEMRNEYILLAGKLGRKRPFRTPVSRLKNYIKVTDFI
jgi:hypothetical protein